MSAPEGKAALFEAAKDLLVHFIKVKVRKMHRLKCTLVRIHVTIQPENVMKIISDVSWHGHVNGK